MPTYEYLCNACGHEFEREQRITDSPVRTCPACKKRRVERLISQTSFVLKGSGWYSDLYSSRKAEKADKADDAKDKGAEAKPDSTQKDAPASKSKDKKRDSKSDAKTGATSGGKSGGKGKGPKAAA